MIDSTNEARGHEPRLIGVTTFDATDRRILLALDADPRATVAQLAQELGLARGTVHARLERLSRPGVLRAASTRVPAERVGLPMRALVTAEVDQGEFTGMVEDLARIPEVVECLGISGENDLLIQVAARDADHVYDITRRIMRCRGIRRTATSIVLRELRRLVPDLRLTPAQMLTYIDSLRQLRRFARAEQAAARNEAGFVQALGAEHLLTRILRAELALAQNADAAPHLVSEVR